MVNEYGIRYDDLLSLLPLVPLCSFWLAMGCNEIPIPFDLILLFCEGGISEWAKSEMYGKATDNRLNENERDFPCNTTINAINSAIKRF